jgi:hypothetical protein
MDFDDLRTHVTSELIKVHFAESPGYDRKHASGDISDLSRIVQRDAALAENSKWTRRGPRVSPEKRGTRDTRRRPGRGYGLELH